MWQIRIPSFSSKDEADDCMNRHIRRRDWYPAIVEEAKEEQRHARERRPMWQIRVPGFLSKEEAELWMNRHVKCRGYHPGIVEKAKGEEPDVTG